MARTTDEWQVVLTKVGAAAQEVQQWALVFADVIDDATFSLGEDELDDFLVEVMIESENLTRMEENLRYTTPERICRVFPARVRTIAEAQPLVRNPRALAERVYGRRSDLGNVTAEDGWLTRGSGLIQVTGLKNMQRLADKMGIPVRELAELLRTDRETALLASILWYEGNVSDAFANQPRRIRRAVNGPAALEADRAEALTPVAQQALQMTRAA